MKKILICEDDIYLQRDLKVLLTKHDYEVITASTKQEGIYHVLNDKDIDLYLLDVWLPDGDGFMVCEQIRKQNLKPVIFLTACNDEESVVRGLDMGADDYIYKPFRTAELLSRIKANLRHQKKEDNARILCSDGIRLDINQSRVFLKDNELNITPIECRLLQILMNHSEKIVKREQLLERLWDVAGNVVEHNTLTVNISRLRGKLGSEYIETIRGLGYRFKKTVWQEWS